MEQDPKAYFNAKNFNRTYSFWQMDCTCGQYFQDWGSDEIQCPKCSRRYIIAESFVTVRMAEVTDE